MSHTFRITGFYLTPYKQAYAIVIKILQSLRLQLREEVASISLIHLMVLRCIQHIIPPYLRYNNGSR